MQHRQHWKNVRLCLDNCENTLSRLDEILGDVEPCEGPFPIHRDPVLGRQAKLDMKAGGIALLQRQINSSRQALQLSLHSINVQLSHSVLPVFAYT
jgi:hypothetical protein